jgi:glutathione S-transferase
LFARIAHCADLGEYPVRTGHDDVGSDRFRRINPKGGVPALVLDDGTVITESLAILDYIADTSPAARLGAVPDDLVARAQLNESLSDLVSDVHKSWAPFFAPERFSTRFEGWPDAKRAAVGQVDKQYSRLNGVMDAKEWLVLGRRTIADAYLYVMCVWKDMTPTPLSAFPNLAAFKARLDTDPVVMRALAQEALG